MSSSSPRAKTSRGRRGVAPSTPPETSPSPPSFERLRPRLLGGDTPLVWLAGWPGSGRRLLLQSCLRELGPRGGALAPEAGTDEGALRTALGRLRERGARWFLADEWPIDSFERATAWLLPTESLVASGGSRSHALDARARARATVVGPVELLLTPSEVAQALEASGLEAADAEAWHRFTDGWWLPLRLGIDAVVRGECAPPGGVAEERRLVELEALSTFFRERVLAGLDADEIEKLVRVASQPPAPGGDSVASDDSHEPTQRTGLFARFRDGVRMPRALALWLRSVAAVPGVAPEDAPASSGVAIRLLGPPRIELLGGGGSETSWPFRRVLHLLALLALSPEGCSQERVIETLWPESDLQSARANLHPTVSHLRRLLAGGGDGSAILLRAGVYRLNPEWSWWIDVRRFEELAEGSGAEAGPARLAELEEAWKLYRGQLLEGMTEAWTVEPRRRLEQRYRTVLSELADRYADHDRLEQAEDCLRTLLAGDPLREDVHLRLMLLQARRGRTDLVRRQYEHLCRLLARELGTQPLDATVRAVERLLG